ncbi:hypothetical protein D3C76_1769510 [compost metagenome]
MELHVLQMMVKPGVILTEHDGIIYADLLEENGDEHRICQRHTVECMYLDLDEMGLIAGE